MNIEDIAFYANLIIANVWFATGNLWIGSVFMLVCVMILLSRYLNNKKGSK